MAAPVHSQIVIDNSVALSGVGPTTTCTVTPATDEGLLMAVSFDLGSGATVSVASTGQSDVWTLVESVDEAGSQGLRVFKCLSPANPGVSRAIVATFTPSADSRVSAVVGFTGGSKTTVASNKQHQATPTTATDAVSSLTATPPAANSLQYGFSFANHGAAAPAAGTGFTSVSTMWNYGGSDVARVERNTLSSTTAVAATFTAGTNTNHLTITVIVPEAQDNPTISSLTPADGATGVSVSTTLAATFNQNVSAGTGNVNVYEYTAPSSAPIVQTRNTDAQQTNATSFVVDTPGTPIAGDLQILCFSKDDNEAPTGTWPPTGFTLGQSDATGTTNWAGWIYRWCDGSTDPATVTLTESSENWISRGWLIRGADPVTAPVGGTVATGTSTAANPPSVTFPGDAGDACLVLYYVGIDGNSTFSAHPGGYSNTGSDLTTDATTGNRCGQAYGELATSTSGSDNPGALTNTSNAWKAFTIAVRGAPTRTLIETIAITDGSKVTFSSATVTIDPAATLNGSKLHYVLIDSGAIVASDDSAPFLGISSFTAWDFTTGAGSSSTVAPSGIRSRAVAGAFSVLVTSGATGISGAPKAGASLDFPVFAPSGARSQAKAGAPTNDASVQPTGDISGLCGAASVVATPSLSGVRFAARSGAPALLALAQPTGVRSLATSGPSVEVGGTVVAPAGVRSLATSGAPAVVPATLLTGARSLAISGAGSEVAGATVSPSAARSLAVAGAPVVVPIAQLAAARLLAVAGAGSEAPAVPISGVRRSATSGACVTTATPLCSGARSSSPAGASAEGTAAAPTGARSLAVTGATVEVSGSIVSPAGVRSLSKVGAPTLATATAPTGIRPTSVAGPSVEVSGAVVSPAGVRSLSRAGACSVGAVATQLTGCRGATQSGAPSLLPLATPTSIKGTVTSGAASLEVAVAPSGVRARAAAGAPLLVSAAAIAGSRLLAVMGASVESTAFVVSPAGIRGLSTSGASVELPASSTTTASGIRSAAVSGAFMALAQSEVVSLCGIRSLARIGAGAAVPSGSLATMPLPRRDIAFFHTEIFVIKFRTEG